MIAENVRSVLAGLPPGVELVAAAKTRTPEEITEAIKAGVRIIGENFVQEAETARAAIGDKVRWHLIGSLQKNKVKKAVRLFDMIETMDSLTLAQAIDRESAAAGKVMPVLVEVNSGHEPQKSGVLPDDVEALVKEIAKLGHVKILGLMTMGPRFGNPEDARPYFAETRRIFRRLRDSKIAGVEMKYLSMGMTNSYKIALEEGANIVRLGSRIFGE
ncbi:MAG: YggS family pyridoxal phosphate-dependent enzyme [Dehalococcoidia bacterium]|nr:MAG: YggS family pyridoxal phosphate-dependent enzyme [Dehalococcoidia bacterium]